MRTFSADYLRDTRRGLWEDRHALDALSLPDRQRVLDVGCGTGELSRVLAAETDGEVYGVDADRSLLQVASAETGLPMVAGDALRLPFPDDTFDLVVCQALLVNLPDPAVAIEEFARVSTDRVAAVEPDNGDVGVDSTVPTESRLERELRETYLSGLRTDAALGDRTADLFRAAGLDGVTSRRHHHHRRVEPPYDERELQDATRKASGAGVGDHEPELRRVLSGGEYDRLRSAWREMGREVVDQMRAGTYRRVEVVPFDVTVGRV